MQDVSAYYPIAERKKGEVKLLGLALYPVGVEEMHHFIAEVISQQKKAVVLNLNIHCVCLALKSSWLKDFINAAQMVFCDGDGVRWGAKCLGLSVPPKITHDRWIWQLAEFGERRGYRFFFLGARPGVADEAARRLKEQYPKLQIVGTRHGYFNRAGSENDHVVSVINQSDADIVVVGFGMPVQEKWILENWLRLKAHIVLSGGAVFDYASGYTKRAPSWVIRMQCEWLFRVIQEPRRLFKRYATEIPVFFYRILLETMRRRAREKIRG